MLDKALELISIEANIQHLETAASSANRCVLRRILDGSLDSKTLSVIWLLTENVAAGAFTASGVTRKSSKEYPSKAPLHRNHCMNI